jgi:hypothetical protein
MKITRLYCDPVGESRFEEIDVPLTEASALGRLSSRIGAEAVILRETDGGYDYDFHNAPERQFIIMLDGLLAVESSTGEQRQFEGGDILLVEDTTGKGHRSWSVDGKLRRSVFVPIGDARIATG